MRGIALLERIVFASLLLTASSASAQVTVEGQAVVWHSITLTIQGPAAAETDNSPNPFLDIRLQAIFTGPAGQRLVVPGFFDGDGQGGPQGRVWRVRFTPDAPGTWQYSAAFRQGAGVAIQLEPAAGEPLDPSPLTGSFVVAPRDALAPGFLKWGALRYVGKHYLKFQDGPYWLRAGTDEPEDFLGYAGFERTPAKHHYAAARRRLARRGSGLGRWQRPRDHRRAQLPGQPTCQQHLFPDDEYRRRRQGCVALDWRHGPARQREQRQLCITTPPSCASGRSYSLMPKD